MKRRRKKTTYIYEIKTRYKGHDYYYVGKSNNPWLRLEAHKDKAINNKGNNYRKNMIFKHTLHKLKMKVIEKPKMAHWRKREIHWIKVYRKRYGRRYVLNATDGGDGSTGGKSYRRKKSRVPVFDYLPYLMIATFLVILFVSSQ